VSRLLPAATIGLFVFAAILSLAAIAVRDGFLADDGVMLWAGAITAGDGGMSIGTLVAAYPPIPFLASAMLDVIGPAGTPAPALVAAAIGAGVAAIWFASLRRSGLPLAAACATTVLLALHPALLRAAIAGPADMFLVVFMAMLAGALYDLRARSGVSETMAVGLALVGMAFSHPIGAAFACAATPFMILAVLPALAANSAVYVVLTLVFPTLFAAASFAYLSWVFPGSGWSFLVAPAEAVSTWAAAFSRGSLETTIGSSAVGAGIAMALAFVLGAPLAVFAATTVFRRRPLVIPALVLCGASVAAAVLAVATGRFGDPVPLSVGPVILAAVMIIRVPELHRRPAIVLGLLAAGWLGGGMALAILDPRLPAEATAALAGARVNAERADALDLGGVTAARDGVLVDSVNAPAVVIGRGRARGLIAPTEEDFDLAIITSSVRTPFVAVPDPQSGAGAQDRLNKAFPLLYRNGPPGYRLIFRNGSWRLYARD
jgi:membrane protein XagC